MEKLRIADPDTYTWVKERLALISPSPCDEDLALLAHTTVWGLSQEAGLGEAVARGLLSLMVNDAKRHCHAYVERVRRAAETGPTLSRIMATFLAPVLMAGDDFLDRFQNTLEIMLRKGTYTLTTPLEVMVALLTMGDAVAASAYLDVLAATFDQNLTYNQSLRLVYQLPKAVGGFADRHRRSQIRQLHRVVKTDLKLVDPFLDGLEKGAALLDQNALDHFVSQALKRYAQAPDSGVKFISLSSKLGQDACAALQRAVPLTQVSGRLNRYLHARMGHAMVIKPISELRGNDVNVSWVCSDGRFIYLPDEIDRFPDQSDNIDLYKTLVRLEAGYCECRTYEFDLERAADLYPEVARRMGDPLTDDPGKTLCDGERFIDAFFPRDLAADLFNLYEQARVAVHLRRRYPGLVRRVTPLLFERFQRQTESGADHLLAPVFSELVLAQASTQSSAPKETAKLRRRLVAMFHEHSDQSHGVESTARQVCVAFDLIQKSLGCKINGYTPMVFPFDRCLHWDLIGRAMAVQERLARRIQLRLKERGVDLYRSDLRNRLSEQNGRLSVDDLAELMLALGEGTPSATDAVDLAGLDLEDLLQQSVIDFVPVPKSKDDAFCYHEWADHLQDYLHDHTRVYEIEVSSDQHTDFYGQTLVQHHGLVAGMRRAFQLLKPEGLALLRQWPEGDAFDYRAMLDFAMDRRAGLIPSDRLFIKRLKHERDVAVMLLVDISRSTANTAAGGQSTVLDVAKEALVLFCEALQVVGDDFAIAGFSGTGRHCVDFYAIKGFQEPLTENVKSRLSGLAPQRSTRMGAAIRHAASLLSQTDAGVRLLIIVSDGFPNDLGYKADYAIADTRRAVQEARARNFHVKAITVNIGSDPRLDDLYGRVHHHVIGDVREMPDKLLRLYGTLTRV
jgi:uncharacterized UPF0146 family protein